ncbi:pyruvate formate lyase activating enzyme [Raineyella antarctica]|uniref:Pyruvate formate lyase activating enzyme n=1 Tax=Raineyella antarctica TaxID=1577474 RepID=A0A1G6GDP7_9ACTN|nr:AmmeMemoRadiSam system radical SAM enzyme [Raineyella antarctica]SDB80100.1 pyruvate formate lyase activating enzyme [Raineyella antarctica]
MTDSAYPARYWHRLDDGRIQCDLCPRDCRLRDGQRGYCFVRQRVGDQMVLTTYGKSSGFCIDPIEKKPLNHFYPGTSVLSFGTAGCNLGCKFCQNHEISTAREMETLADSASPADLVRAAQEWHCDSLAFTYNDPVIFAEYAMDVAEAAQEAGIHTVAVTAGYIHAEPRRDFYAHMSAANVDLKGFRDDFYRKITGARLGAVLDTLSYLRTETDVWFEITTLLIPGLNDDPEELRQEARWIAAELGPDTPLHFSAFHPDNRMLDTPPTPPATLTRAREIAMDEGLNYVYTGNVHDRAGDTTRCSGCGGKLIVRDWYRILSYRLTSDGRCPDCGQPLPGRFGAEAGDFGPRRIPIRIGHQGD